MTNVVTVTGLTKDRMISMEQATVISGHITGNDLILVTKGGTQINAGNVRGPVGAVGPPGPPPYVGEIRMTILFQNLPTGWFFLSGQTIANAQTLYTQLWAVAPASWKVGADLKLPNAARRHLVGNDPAEGTVGRTGGTDAITLAVGHMPVHNHAPGTLLAVNEPAHKHTIPEVGARNNQGHIATQPQTSEQGLVTGLDTGSAGAHDHNISGATANTGGGAAYTHRPQYLTVNMMIYAGTN